MLFYQTKLIETIKGWWLHWQQCFTLVGLRLSTWLIQRPLCCVLSGNFW